jgi:hypothetical protein
MVSMYSLLVYKFELNLPRSEDAIKIKIWKVCHTSAEPHIMNSPNAKPIDATRPVMKRWVYKNVCSRAFNSWLERWNGSLNFGNLGNVYKYY